MGVWGPDIFDDDFALDVKGDYGDMLRAGLSHEGVTKILNERYHDALQDPEESGVFWLALAAIQLKDNALVKDVQANALDVINSGRDILRWEGSPEENKRKEVLNHLKNQLLKKS